MRGIVLVFLILTTLTGCQKETRANRYANFMPEVSSFDNSVDAAKQAADDESRKRAEEAEILQQVAESANSKP